MGGRKEDSDESQPCLPWKLLFKLKLFFHDQTDQFPILKLQYFFVFCVCVHACVFSDTRHNWRRDSKDKIKFFQFFSENSNMTNYFSCIFLKVLLSPSFSFSLSPCPSLNLSYLLTLSLLSSSAAGAAVNQRAVPSRIRTNQRAAPATATTIEPPALTHQR